MQQNSRNFLADEACCSWASLLSARETLDEVWRSLVSLFSLIDLTLPKREVSLEPFGTCWKLPLAAESHIFLFPLALEACKDLAASLDGVDLAKRNFLKQYYTLSETTHFVLESQVDHSRLAKKGEGSHIHEINAVFRCCSSELESIAGVLQLSPICHERYKYECYLYLVLQ